MCPKIEKAPWRRLIFARVAEILETAGPGDVLIGPRRGHEKFVQRRWDEIVRRYKRQAVPPSARKRL